MEKIKRIIAIIILSLALHFIILDISFLHSKSFRASQLVPVVKNLSANAEDLRHEGLIPGLGRSLEEDMTTHSSILAWRIP